MYMKLPNLLASSKLSSLLPPLNSSLLQSSPMAAAALSTEQKKQYQKIIVMRHGDRMDNVDPMWLSKAVRKWDPPLHDVGHDRSISAGKDLNKSLGYPIHRIFVSPFLRCLQTASQIALHLANDDNKSSNIKVSIQYGLCEMFNNIAIRHPPMEGQEWGFDNVAELEKELPVGTIDTCQQVNTKLPKWGETTDDARARYEGVIRTLADKYPNENLLFVTHGEGLNATVATFMRNVKIRKVQYCGYLLLHREIRGGGGEEEPFEAKAEATGEFELLRDQSVGMIFTSLSNGSL